MRATYDTIYFDLKQQIEEYVYPYKSFLPSEARLIQRYGCAHNTVRKALAELAANGYVQPIHGKGVRVIYQSLAKTTCPFPSYTPDSIASFHIKANHSGLSTSSDILLMEDVTVDEELAKLSHFDEGDELVHFKIVHSYDGVPLVCEESYYRSDAVAGITKDDATQSVVEYIENVANVKLVTCKRRITIEHTTERDRELLKIDDFDSVVVVNSVVYDSDGVLCFFSSTRHHPKVFSLIQTVRHTRLSPVPNKD